MKKMLSFLMCSVMFIGLLFPTTVSAAENGCSVCTNNIAEHAESEFLLEIDEDYEKIVFVDKLQKKGDVQVLGTWDGEVYCVEVVDVTEFSCAQFGSNDLQKTKSFVFTKTNIFGVKTYLLGVTATLKWIKNTKITSFECSEIIYHESVAAWWEPGYVDQTDGLWMRSLNVIWDNGNYENVCFIGCLFTIDGVDTVDVSCSASFEK